VNDGIALLLVVTSLAGLVAGVELLAKIVERLTK
tara:strand:+ start:783 stop:884 length:102 start_codon:yes stop_codon:yes gene_type:complete